MSENEKDTFEGAEPAEMADVQDESLEEIAGGYIHHNYEGSGKQTWEVIDDMTGDVICTFRSKRDAMAAARDYCLSKDEIRWCEVQKLRESK
ncbi:MAG: hypothetical protein IJ092_06795 [Atopobiaceae bacterium]|nr:hypothetical protein [Atopobiaceae bacterium]MBR1830577.1 hypothetical protein [Atopobiaceae bacterium]